jgi:hypothetical protein
MVAGTLSLLSGQLFQPIDEVFLAGARATTRAYAGTHSAKFTTNGGAGYERAYCYKSITGMSIIYVRSYIYVSKSGILDQSDRLFFIVLRAGGESLVYAGWKKIPPSQGSGKAATRWCISVKYQGAYHDFTGLFINEAPGYKEPVPLPVLYRWYSVELFCKQVPGGMSEVELYVNGVKATATQNKYGEIPWANPISSVRFGFAEPYGVGASTVYVDSCVIDKAYIPP